MSITRLPRELVLDVFELAAEGPLRTRDALALSHINQSLRNLALTTPSLWTVLDSFLGATCAREFAARSDPRPLDVRMYEYGVDGDWTRLHGFAVAVLEWSDRWAKLTIDAMTASVFRELFVLIDDSVSRRGPGPRATLDALVMRIRPKVDSEPYPWMERVPFATRSLELDGVPAWTCGYFTDVLERLVLRNLEGNMDTAGVDPDLLQLTGVLCRAPNLRELVVDASVPRGPEMEPDTIHLNRLPSLTLAWLHSLTLAWVDDRTAYRFLSMTSMPALRSLQLRLVNECALAWHMLDVLRSAPLQELSITMTDVPRQGHVWRSIPPSGQEARPPLSQFLRLETLVLDGTYIHDDGVRGLATLPRLRSLTLRFEWNVSPGSLEELLRARLADQRVVPIEYLEVQSCTRLKVAKEVCAEALAQLVPELRWFDIDRCDIELDSEPSDSESDSDSDWDAQIGDTDISEYEDDRYDSHAWRIPG